MQKEKIRNPLIKRIPKELKSEFGKYAVIFLFLTVTIGFISGFLVADNSMTEAYEKSFEKYNIEDGNFELTEPVSLEMKRKLAEENIKIYDNIYLEKQVLNENTTLRIFANREEVNLICLMKGRLPEVEGEIAVDRLFADKNKIHIGEEIEIDNRKFQVTGLAAFSDYSALFSDNAEMMFDAKCFGVAVVTGEQFQQMSLTGLHYSYSWQYEDKTQYSRQEEYEYSERLMKILAMDAGNPLLKFTPEYSSQAIRFSGNDMGKDKSMILVLLYIIMVILAFIFAVTIGNTIEKEAAVIGTLWASGYTRNELAAHYIGLPVIVSVTACVIGNILGYSLFKEVVAGMYYNSYSLPAYETLWNGEAFLLTTVIPCIIMLVVNLFILYNKLSLTPLKLLRNDLAKHKTKKAVRLPEFKFLARFRIRIIIQNKSGYFLLLIGIVFANILMLFGLMLEPLLDHYGREVEEKLIADYQYILKRPAATESAAAEAFAVTTLQTDFSKKNNEEITVYGIKKNSGYVVRNNIPLNYDTSGVYVSEGILEKFHYSIGDTLNLKELYTDKTYEMTIVGSYDYPAGMAVFMSNEEFCRLFGKEEGYFNGYFSNEEIADIDAGYISSIITLNDVNKVVRQLNDSMGSLFPLIKWFAFGMAMLIIYLLSKLVLEKNASSISMVKILGYGTGEIGKLYISSTTVAVAVSILISLPFSYGVLNFLYAWIMSSISGWITYYIKWTVFAEMVFFGAAAYAIVTFVQYRKIKKIPMEAALKNTEI